MEKSSYKDISSLKVSSISYYFAFLCYVLWNALTQTAFVDVLPEGTYSSIKTILQGLTVVFILVKIVSQKYDFKRFIVLSLFGLVALLSFSITGFSIVTWAFFFIMAGDEISIKRLCSIALVVYIVITIIAVTMSLSGSIPNKVFVRGGVVRDSYGFNHPNTFGQALLEISLAISVLRYKKFGAPEFLLISFFAILTWVLVDSRTSSLMIFLTAVLFFVFSRPQKYQRSKYTAYVFLTVVVLILIGLSYYFMLFYSPSNPLHALLNRVLSGRLYFSHGWFTWYPPSLFGTHFGSNVSGVYSTSGYASSSIMVDNAYSYLTIQFGYLLTLFFIVCIVFVLLQPITSHLKSKHNFGKTTVFSLMPENLALVVCLIVGVSEAYVLNFSFNYYLLLIFQLVFSLRMRK